MKKKIAKNHPKQHRGTFRTRVLPPIAGLLATILVLGLCNSQHISSKINAWTYTPEPTEKVIKEDKATKQAKPDPTAPSTLTINSIRVQAPVIYGLQSVEEWVFQKALEDGVVHYPNTARPGEPGNVAIFGHSSGQVWAPGDYKSVFAHLDKLGNGDKIFLSYQGMQYMYEVTGSKVVPPTEISVLNPTPKPTLTLITCTPVGTNTNRLVITAEQISPDPQESEAVYSQILDEAPIALPSNTPSLIRAFRSIFD